MICTPGGVPEAAAPIAPKHYSLTHLRDHVLRQELSACARRESVTTADLLARIAEFDERRLYSDAACSSMLDYCVRRLHMSEDSALKRIRVARMARAFPAIYPMLAEGRLNLSGVLLLGPSLNAVSASELLAAAVHKTNAEIEMMLAMRSSNSAAFPNSGNKVAVRPVVPSDFEDGADSMEPLPSASVGREPGGDASNGFALAVCDGDACASDERTGNALGVRTAADDLAPAPSAASDTHGPRANAQAGLTNSADLVATAPAAHGLPRYLKFTPVSAECASLRGMLSLEAMREFKRLQELVGKLGASADAAELLEKAIKAYADAVEKKKFGTGARTRPSSAGPNSRRMPRPGKTDPNHGHSTRPSNAAANRRYIPAAIRKAVHQRDGRQCTFVSPAGERCACRAGLQFDHVKPLGRGGETTAPNLRLLCGAHNQLEARRAYGESFIRVSQERARVRAGARVTSGAKPVRARRVDGA